MRRLILAPSGAGKTTVLQPYGVKDMDHEPEVRAVYTKMDADFEPKWWDRPDYHWVVAPAKLAAMIPAFKIVLERPGCYATAELSVAAMLVAAEVLKKTDVLVWTPSVDELAAHHAKRATEKSNQPAWTREKVSDVVWNYLAQATSTGFDALLVDVPSRDVLLALGVIEAPAATPSVPDKPADAPETPNP